MNFMYVLMDHRRSVKLFRKLDSAKKYAEESWAEEEEYEWEHVDDEDGESWHSGEYISIVKTEVMD